MRAKTIARAISSCKFFTSSFHVVISAAKSNEFKNCLLCPDSEDGVSHSFPTRVDESDISARFLSALVALTVKKDNLW